MANSLEISAGISDNKWEIGFPTAISSHVEDFLPETTSEFSSALKSSCHLGDAFSSVSPNSGRTDFSNKLQNLDAKCLRTNYEKRQFQHYEKQQLASELNVCIMMRAFT